MTNYHFPKSVRVRRGHEFTFAIRKGRCVADGTLVMFVVANQPDSPARLGITVPKKTGNAVVRNRWKRLIREAFRTQVDQVPTGYDYIVRPKKNATPDGVAIMKSIPRLARRATKSFSKPSS